jgi:hypothetical protein
VTGEKMTPLKQEFANIKCVNLNTIGIVNMATDDAYMKKVNNV